MSEITTLEEARLSKMSDDELIVTAIERASNQILAQSLLIKNLTLRVGELEETTTENDNEISLIKRILDSI